MAEVLRMEPATEVAIHNYPEERRYTRWGLAASIGSHVTVILIVLILAYLNNIKSLRDFMAASVNQPPPPTEVEVILLPDEIPPPPTDHPLFIKQILQVPKPIIPPKPKPKPVPKPHPIVQHHVTASHVESKAESQMVVGSGHLMIPDYPPDLMRRGVTGVVGVRVTFDSTGRAVACEIISSSGYSEFDNHTKSFILDNWQDSGLAGQTQPGSVVYQIPGH